MDAPSLTASSIRLAVEDSWAPSSEKLHGHVSGLIRIFTDPHADAPRRHSGLVRSGTRTFPLHAREVRFFSL
jgi:hypothetical protein